MCAKSARAVHHQRQRISHDRRAGAGLDRLGRQMPAEGARARHRAEQAEQVARDGMQPRAARQLALDIGDERQRGLFRRRERRRLAEQQRIDRQQPPRLLIGGAAHHHAVDVLQMLGLRLLERGDAAIEHDRRNRDAPP